MHRQATGMRWKAGRLEGWKVGRLERERFSNGESASKEGYVDSAPEQVASQSRARTLKPTIAVLGKDRPGAMRESHVVSNLWSRER